MSGMPVKTPINQHYQFTLVLLGLYVCIPLYILYFHASFLVSPKMRKCWWSSSGRYQKAG